MWVRGLKLKRRNVPSNTRTSHPMWVRGLKRVATESLQQVGSVASYVGAWIETRFFVSVCPGSWVASYVGAWIETYNYLSS